MDYVKILDVERRWFERGVKEAIYPHQGTNYPVCGTSLTSKSGEGAGSPYGILPWIPGQEYTMGHMENLSRDTGILCFVKDHSTKDSVKQHDKLRTNFVIPLDALKLAAPTKVSTKP